MPTKRCCCGGGCPSIVCGVSGTTLTYTISGAASATLRTYNNGLLISTEAIEPPNGTVIQSSPGGYTYFIDAISADGCLVSSPCSNPDCSCGIYVGYVPIDVVDTSGTWAEGNGTYYATLYRLVGFDGGCYFSIQDSAFNIFRRQYVVGFGPRIQYNGVSRLSPANHCIEDVTYNYTIGSGVLSFTVRAT